MAKYGSDKVGFFLLGGYDILGSMTQISDSREAVLEETTPLGVANQTHAPTGLLGGEMTQEGFYDDAVAGAHDALSTGPGVSRVLCYGIEGNTIGLHFVGWEGAMEVSYKRQVQRGALTKALASYKTNGAMEDGKILLPYGLLTAGASGQVPQSVIDNAVLTASGAAFYLEVEAVTCGASSLGLRVDHSSNNVAYTPLISFTGASNGARYGERVAATGQIERYTRFVPDYQAVGDTITVFAGVVRGLTT